MGVTAKSRGRHILAGSPVIIPIPVPGALAAGDGAAFYKATFPFTLHQIQGVLGTLHTTSTGGSGETVNVRNATDTLDFMDTPNRMMFTDTWTEITQIATSLLQNRTVDIDDVIAVDVDVIDSGTGAADLMVYLVGERRVK